MNKIKTDFTACLVSGGPALRERVRNAAMYYSPESSGYFAAFEEKTGKAFEESACGFLLLDSLLQKYRINRAELALAREDSGRPVVSNRSDLDFSISHSEGCAFCCIAIGEGANIGGDIQRDRGYEQERISELVMTFMDDEEMAAFYYAEDKAKEFYTAWTRHEAYIKRIGGSVVESLRDVNIRGEQFSDGIITACGNNYYYSINVGAANERPNKENL